MDEVLAEHQSGGDGCLKDDQTTKDEVHTAEIQKLILLKFKMKIPGKAPSNKDESPPSENTGSKASIIGD